MCVYEDICGFQIITNTANFLYYLATKSTEIVFVHVKMRIQLSKDHVSWQRQFQTKIFKIVKSLIVFDIIVGVATLDLTAMLVKNSSTNVITQKICDHRKWQLVTVCLPDSCFILWLENSFSNSTLFDTCCFSWSSFVSIVVWQRGREIAYSVSVVGWLFRTLYDPLQLCKLYYHELDDSKNCLIWN